MGKFKVGDEVRRTSCFDENIASGRYFSGEAFKIAMVNYHGGIIDPDGMTHAPQYLEHVAEIQVPIKSPIRTVTRREPVEGKYGIVQVDVHNGQIVISISPEDGHQPTGDQLRSAAMVISQIAEFRDGIEYQAQE